MNALEWLDSGFALCRRAGTGFALRSWGAGLPLAFACVLCFYLERVEGVREVRGLLALTVALGWWARAHALGRASRYALAQLGEPPGSPPSALRTLGLSSVAGSVLGVALLPAAALASFGALALIPALTIAVPIGIIAPSWLARAGVDAQTGAGVWAGATQDARTLRGSALLLHGCLWAGTLLLFLNVLGATAMLLGAFRSFLGIEVAALMSFLSLENDFAVLVMGAFALLLGEPLRVALATVALMHARSRRDGADLRRMVSALALADSPETAGRPRRGVGATAALLVSLLVAPARAQLAEPPAAESGTEASLPGSPTHADAFDHLAREDAFGVGGAPTYEDAPELYFGDELPPLAASDQAIVAELTEILARPEFREFGDASAEHAGGADESSLLTRLLEALRRWLEGLQPDEGEALATPAPMPLPPAWVFGALAGALLLAVLAYVALSWRREEAAGAKRGDALPLALDPRERAPEEHLDEAAALAAQGRYREAFRSLYLATLVALDRRGEIDFDASRTNWHYLRQMGPSGRAPAFRTFTQLFDRKWYGDELTTAEEYERGRELARSLAASSEGAHA